MRPNQFAGLIRLVMAVVGLALPACSDNPNANSPIAASVSAVPRWLEFVVLTPRPLAAAPDGRHVAVQGGCETILYDLASDKRLQAWTGQAYSARFSGDGSCLLLVRRGHDVVVWDIERSVPRRRFTGRAAAWGEPGGYSHRTCAAVNHDASQVAIANSGKAFDCELPQAILIYDVSSGRLQQTMPLPAKATVNSLEFVPHHDRFLVSFHDWESKRRERQLELRDTQTADLILSFQPDDLARVSPNGRWIAAGRVLGHPAFSSPGRNQGIDSTRLTVWDTQSGLTVRTLEHPSPPRDFTFDPKSERLLAALTTRRSDPATPSASGRLIEWQVATGRTIFEGFDSDIPYASVMYSPDGRRRFATTEQPSGLDDDVDHLLRGWNVATGAELPIGDSRFASYNGREQLFFLPEGDRFIDLAAGFEVRETLSGKTVETLPKYRAPMTEAAFTPDGKKFLVGQSQPLLTELTTGRQRRWLLNGRQHTFVDNGRTLFSVDVSGIYLTDVDSGRVFWHLFLQMVYGQIDAAISADAKRIVVAHRINDAHASDTRITLLEPSRPDAPRILKRYVTAVAMRPNGERFLAATEKGIEEFAFDSGESLGVLWSPPGRVLCLAYSSDGQRIIAAGVRGHANWREPVNDEDLGWTMLWNAATNTAISCDGHTAPVTTAAFNRDGSRCVTGSHDRTIRLWNTDNGLCLHVFRGHLGTVRRVAFSPRGDAILSAAEDGAALWNAEQFDQPLASLSESFQVFETIDAFPPASRGGPTVTRPDPAAVQADWPDIELGDIDHRDLPRDVRNWLIQTKEARGRDATGPARARSALAGYDYCGSSRDGRRSVFVSKGANKIVLVDGHGKVLNSWEGRPTPGQVAISPSGKEVAIVRELRSAQGERYEVHIFDSDSGQLHRVIDDIDTWHLVSIEIMPNEKTILLRINNNSLDLRDYRTGESLATLKNAASGAGLHSMISPRGRYIATSKYPDANVYLRDPKTLAVLQTLTNPLPVRWLRFSTDSQHLLVGQPYTRDDGTLLTMWDVETARELWSRAGGYRSSTWYNTPARHSTKP